MILVIQILFWLCLVLLGYHYVGFPIILKVLSRGKTNAQDQFNEEDDLPKVSILLAAYNEEDVIEQKIKASFDTNYPLGKLEMLIGSDASDDRTDEIIKQYQSKFPGLKFHRFGGRTGKPNIINALEKEVQGDVLILTDANVFFEKNTIWELVKYFKSRQVGLVGGSILNYNIKKDGISAQEGKYLSLENQMKFQEGALWGTMIGAFGGMFAIRKTEYRDVPPNFVGDDLYWTLEVVKNNKDAINNLGAIAYEDVSNELKEEFNRKKRIAIGNFQNLNYFKSLIVSKRKGVAFSFTSHKVVRWFGPWFLLVALLTNIWLAYNRIHSIYDILLLGQMFVYSVPLVDFIFGKLGIHFKLLRFIRHFLGMNVALMAGMFSYLKGVESNVWTPTERNQ